MEGLRILFISSRSDLGGGPKYLADLIVSIGSEAQVFVAAPNCEPFGPQFKKFSLGFFELPHRKFGFALWFSLLKWAKKNRIQVVHSHGTGAGIYSRLMKLAGFKVVHSYHGIHPRLGVVGKIRSCVERFVNPLTDAFVFVSESEKKIATQRRLLGTRSSIVVYPMFRNVGRVSLEPKQLKPPFKLGALARLDRIKGLDLLLNNLSCFRKMNPEIEWSFSHAGGGTDFPVIPEDLKDRVQFIGPVDEPFEFLRSLDVFLSSSLSEAFNISVLEAISQGLPCLISDIPGHHHFIKAGAASGFKIDQPTDFSFKLNELLKNVSPDSSAQKRFMEVHLSENSGEKYLIFLKQLCE